MQRAMEALDPYQRPPDSVRNVYKKYQRMSLQDLDADPRIVQLSQHAPADPASKLHVIREVDADRLTASFRSFVGGVAEVGTDSGVAVYEHEDMPGRPLSLICELWVLGNSRTARCGVPSQPLPQLQ
jgi:alkylated DNA repair protein alkB family protein 1